MVFNANEKQAAESSNSLNIRMSNHVNASPRNEVLQRLRDLQAHPLSPRFTQDDIYQRLHPLLKNESSSQPRCKLPEVLSKFEIMETKERRQSTRFRDDKHKLSTREEIGKQSQHVVSIINSPSPDHVLSKPVAVPFKWEEEPGKAKTAVDRAIARRLSRDGLDYMGSSLQNGDVVEGIGVDPSGSHRYYGREYLRGLSREESLRWSSRRYSTSEKQVLIDFDGSAAAKFLVEAFESPSRLHGSSPTFVVPFKWEDVPGKAKVDSIALKPYNVLKLPPRLAVGKSESFSSCKHRISSSFFLPCLTPAHQKQITRSKNLPPKVPSPPKRRISLGLISRCSSIPREGCQVRVSKPKTSSHTSTKKLFIKPQQARNMSTPSSPTSILLGLDEGNSQTSGSSTMFSSGELEDFHKSASKSSSSTSYENAEEDFAEFVQDATTTSAEETGLLSKRRAPTSRGYVNNKGERFILETLHVVQSKETNSSPDVSPKRRSRLPYKMPAAKSLVSKSPPARLRRRVRLMSSILKTLKRALSRKKRHCKRSEALLTHLEDRKSRAATFRSKTTYT